MQADILTLMIPAMTLIFSAVFVGLWWQDRSRTYILAYAYWFTAVALGIILQAWIIKDFGPREVVLFHALSSSGILALFWGVARRDGRRFPLIALTVVTITTGVVIWFARAQEVQPVVLMAQNYNAALMMAIGAHGKWMTPRQHVADRVLLLTFVLLAAYSMFRPSITVLLQSQMTMAEYQISVMLTVNMAVTALLCLMLSLALISTVIADNMQLEREKSTLDPLSGLPNRGAFEDAVKLMQQRADNEKLPLSLIVADLDHFKQVNDTLGHATGDLVIRSFGQLIAGSIRPCDIAGRIGGEEFCILAWACDGDQALSLADRMRIAAPKLRSRHGEQDAMVTASFGVASFLPADSYADVFKRADTALYKAKEEGRNRACLWINDNTFVGQPKMNPQDSACSNNVISLAR